jgi:hypothetical protein
MAPLAAKLARLDHFRIFVHPAPPLPKPLAGDALVLNVALRDNHAALKGEFSGDRRSERSAHKRSRLCDSASR